jgi:hypothetical protein
MSRSRPAVAPLLFAALALAACGPSAEDEKNMKEKMELETKRADILMSDKNDCKKMGKELAEFKAGKDGKRLAELDPWWGGLGKSAKNKLIDAHKAEWDKQSAAMVLGGGSCMEEFKANF